jgi:hypothetical protein
MLFINCLAILINSTEILAHGDKLVNNFGN